MIYATAEHLSAPCRAQCRDANVLLGLPQHSTEVRLAKAIIEIVILAGFTCA